MLFTSYKFFVFVPLVVLIYFIVPKKARPVCLLAASYAFYLGFGVKHLIPLLSISAVSYAGGIAIERTGNKSRKKMAATGLVAAFLIFFIVFKYLGFVISNINSVASVMGRESVSIPFSLVQPVGISYLILQIISYLVDIYKGEIPAEKNIINYFLYVSFFPKILSGPIEKGKRFLDQVKESTAINLWDAVRIRDGLTRIAWGYFLKMVISDRLGPFVDTVFSSYSERGTIVLTAGICAYYFQLFADFIGSMDISIGLAKVMGYELSENFRGPMFSRSVTESWTRWHMTLGEWLKKYVYIPLGGSRHGKAIKYRNAFIVFAVSGLWHGAAWHYVAWGLINGVYEAIEGFGKQDDAPSALKNAFRVVRTWILWLIAITFFRSDSVPDAVGFLKRMLTVPDFEVIRERTIFELGISQKYMVFLFIAIIAMAIVEFIRFKLDLSDIAPLFGQKPAYIRLPLMILLLMVIIIFGAYGPAYNASNFIYFGF